MTVMLTEDDRKFLNRVQSTLQTVQAWDADADLVLRCRSEIPLLGLEDFSHPEDIHLSGNALFLQRLCRWFQKSMTWVNSPDCPSCNTKTCEFQLSRGPETAEEQQGQASRVEVFTCLECNERTTFPRYNNVAKLLETKQGRCGEYANLFGLVCRAAGFETRYIMDVTDHVWTEVYVEDHWIMADGCEGVIDKPSMYEHGWGKQGLSYMVAVSVDHIVDVTPRYTRKYLSDELQSKRREYTSSEAASQQLLKQLNEQVRMGLPQARLQELDRRKKLEEAELQACQQATEWTLQETYGRGRISGSLAWKQSRQEAGTQEGADNQKKQAVSGFQVESFTPPWSDKLTITVRPSPKSRQEGICISRTPCAVGELDSMSVVVVDEMGCILQSRSFLYFADLTEFVDTLPANRIVAMNGTATGESKSLTSRLGGWKVADGAVVYIGQVDAHPDWAYFATHDECPKGMEVELPVTAKRDLRLRTERQTRPHRVGRRLPETTMPLSTQLMATDEQKRIAFTLFAASNKRCSGYTTKPNAPVYLLDATAYPLQRGEHVDPQDCWNTFHYLPSPLVPESDQGIVNAAKGTPKFDVPLEMDFFTRMLGNELLVGNARLPTTETLHNSRLVGLYFSAHWCGPCRSFTPMLAEMYEHLKEEYPSHGLEIVFVSSDRDSSSFQQYYGSMPWQAIPFENVQSGLKQQLSMTYGVRGIPFLVVLDAISGQVVVPGSQSRNEVMMACRGGDLSIETMLATWLERTPPESIEILSMLEISCQDQNKQDDKENPYLVREKPKEAKGAPDAASRIKELFMKLVQEGSDPTAAAAKAIQMVADEQKNPSLSKLEPGPLDGKATRSGPPLEDESSIDLAMAHVIEWNSVDEVKTVLSTALKYLVNSKKEPWAPKFRTFKLSNKVADQITRIEGGLNLLQSIGFEVYGTNQDFMATIPLAVDLDAMDKEIKELLEGLE